MTIKWDYQMAFSDILVIDAIRTLNEREKRVLSYEEISRQSGVSWRTVARAINRQKNKRIFIVERTRYGCKYEVYDDTKTCVS